MHRRHALSGAFWGVAPSLCRTELYLATCADQTVPPLGPPCPNALPPGCSELDSKLYNLMVHLCSQQDEVPMSVAECEQCVKRFFPQESAALSTWAISEANTVRAVCCGGVLWRCAVAVLCRW